ncbi:hypothetical protein BN844_0092 [Pseudomonas sp. SHC52]|nr:hypothetical protein BN844_0092 [Pseudomonas sp. SHC52]
MLHRISPYREAPSHQLPDRCAGPPSVFRRHGAEPVTVHFLGANDLLRLKARHGWSWLGRRTQGS